MKRRFFLLPFMLLMLAVSAFGQRSLEVRDVTTGLNVFSGKDTEAGMVFIAPSNIGLSFESTHDKMVNVYNVEQKGEETYYYIRFQTGKRYRGRKLTILTDNYAPVNIAVDLSPKELKQYQLLDPDVEFVYGCYYEYRKRGTEFYQKAMYNEAKEQYNIAKECSDCPADANLDELISNVDSIQVYLKRADEAFEIMNYTEASELYGRVLLLNPSDINASEKRFNCHRLSDNDCKKFYDAAEVYKEGGDFEKALELYRKVISLNCSNTLVASEEAKKIEILLQARKQKARAFVIEGGGSGIWGFSYGKYKNRKAGGYFSLNANYHLIEAAQQEPEKCGIGRVMETGFSFGWTFCPVPKFPYVWLFLGPGYTGAGQYLPKSFVDEVAESDDDKYNFNWYNSFAPEGGVLIKVGPAVLRYTFQYRLAFDDASKDLFEDRATRHMFGVGVCF